MSKPLILAIETATRAGGVALTRGEKILASRIGDASVSHSSNLIEMIREVLREAGVELGEVDVFAVAVGPGSFTGLRIGLATTKAFAVHLNRRVVGISSLAAVAHASEVNGEIVSLLPAGRGEMFAQRFATHEGTVTAIDEPQHLGPRAVMQRYTGVEGIRFAGEGVQMLEAWFGVPPLGGNDSPTVPPEGGTSNYRSVLVKPLAPAIALLGFQAYREGKFVAPENLHAVYVRASDAEINERWHQQKAQPQAQS